MLAADPLNTTPLRLDEEQREIDQRPAALRYRDLFDMQAVFAVRIEDMRRAMLRYEPEIVHFSGHGQDGNIYLEDKNGNARAIASDALGDFFSIFPSVQCVLLNACYSEELAAAITQTVPYVIGMQTEVQDAVRHQLCRGLLRCHWRRWHVRARLSCRRQHLEVGRIAAMPPIRSSSKRRKRPERPRRRQLITPETSIALAAQPLQVTRLSGPQFKQFHEALLAAFDQESLARWSGWRWSQHLTRWPAAAT